jgi:hypothetical protein
VTNYGFAPGKARWLSFFCATVRPARFAGGISLKRAALAAGLVVVAVVLTNCNCGGNTPLGGFCNTAADCESRVCGFDNRCASAGDGGTGGAGGNSGAGGGQGGGLATGGGASTGGGMGTLPDGGACTGLQCQVAACTGTTPTTLTGKVYDPAGNVPLYNAIVYVPNVAVKPFSIGTSCDACGALVSGNPVAIALSGADGAFRLENVPSGNNIPLVVQIGKWRRQVNLAQVMPCEVTKLTDVDLTRLPRNQSEGDLPQIALASGDVDAFECLLRKIGVSDSEFTVPGGTGRVHFYRQNGGRLPMGTPAASTLWTDAGTLLNYDVVLLPCEGQGSTKNIDAVRNMVAYADKGGRIFTTHYGYAWTQKGWPAAAVWDTGLNDMYNQVFNVTVDQSFPKGMAFAQWLSNVGASTTLGTLGLLESRHDVTAVKPGSTRWLYGDIVSATPDPTASVQHLTYNTPFADAGTLPDGGAAPQCGRVVYSDFHVTAGAIDAGGGDFPGYCIAGPLSAQEKALEFMLFDLSACVEDDATGPVVCKVVGQGCGSDKDCCANLKCVDALGNDCNGAQGCSCEPVIN